MKEQKKLVNINSDRDCFITLKRWLENRNAGKNFSMYFKTCGYQSIAIYGAGDLGHLLYAELKGTDIKVSYFVDRNAEGICMIEGVPVVTIEEIKTQQEVDILIITPIGNYNSINQLLINIYPELPTISLKDIVYEM